MPPTNLTRYLEALGIEMSTPATRQFDPGYDVATVEAHLEQSAHLMERYKLSVGWMLTSEPAVRRKIAAAEKHGVPVVLGGGPFEIAVAAGKLDEYLDLCADLGVARIECGEGFTDHIGDPDRVVSLAHDRGLEVEFELGKKHGGPFTASDMSALIDLGRRWLDAGAKQLVIEARESALGVGLFDVSGAFNDAFADRFAESFGLDTVVFEAPTKPSQFALLDHLGPRVRLSNVRLEEVLRVEAYRRGLHSDAFVKGLLTLPGDTAAGPATT